MALSPSNATETARMILADHTQRERARLDRIAYALNPKYVRRQTRPSDAEAFLNDTGLPPPSVIIPSDATPEMHRLARKARTNYLPRVLNEFVQSLGVVGYRADGGTDNAAPWRYGWQANGLDSRQIGVHRDALAYGVSYMTVLPGVDPITGEPMPVMRGVSPRKLTALYADPVDDDWPMFALRHDDPLLRLYDDEQVYFIGKEGPGASGPNDFTFIEAQGHGMNVPPVVRYRDAMLLDENDQTGIIEPLLPLQERLDETVFGLLVAQFFAAFKQRVILGWVPKTEEEKLQASSSRLWTFKDGGDMVKIDEFTETPLAPYVESKESVVTDMATIAQVPPQSLGNGAVANISAEALAAMEASKNRRGDQFSTSLGESHEQALRLAAMVMGDTESATDRVAQVRWSDKEARSFAQLVDGLGKAVTMLAVPARATWPMVASALGMSDQDVEAWEKIAQESDALANLQKLLDEQATAGKPPSAAEVEQIVATSSADNEPPPAAA